jgi:hypothetical protein
MTTQAELEVEPAGEVAVPGQAVQAVAPEREYVFAGHWSQKRSVGALLELYRPAGHEYTQPLGYAMVGVVQELLAPLS